MVFPLTPRLCIFVKLMKGAITANKKTKSYDLLVLRVELKIPLFQYYGNTLFNWEHFDIIKANPLGQGN